MIEAVSYACSNWLITPAALAGDEVPPTDVREQRFVLVLSGVAFLDLKAENAVYWTHGTAVLRPDLSAPLAYAVGQHQIPTPPGEPSLQYTYEFLVEQCAPFANNASTSTDGDGISIGWACDAWRPHHYETRPDAVTSAPLHPLFAGIEADLAVRGAKAIIQRVNYHVTLVGKIRFAAVIIT